jgi:hypothetical protein
MLKLFHFCCIFVKIAYTKLLNMQLSCDELLDLPEQSTLKYDKVHTKHVTLIFIRLSVLTFHKYSITRFLLLHIFLFFYVYFYFVNDYNFFSKSEMSNNYRYRGWEQMEPLQIRPLRVRANQTAHARRFK